MRRYESRQTDRQTEMEELQLLTFIVSLFCITCHHFLGTDSVGKLNLVDLAGSERQAKTHAEGQRLKEVRIHGLASIETVHVA